MRIVVLCGGLSTERKISISSGTKICGALRQKGHQAVLVDLFLGLEDMPENVIRNPEVLFDELPELKPVVFDGASAGLVGRVFALVLIQLAVHDLVLDGDGFREVGGSVELVPVAVDGELPDAVDGFLIHSDSFLMGVMDLSANQEVAGCLPSRRPVRRQTSVFSVAIMYW